MAEEKKEKTLTFDLVTLKPDHSGANKYTTSLIDNEGNAFDLDSLKKSINNVLKDNEEYVKKILYFAGGISQNYYEAQGFVLGWITKAAISAHESKNGIKLQIKLEETTLTNEEIRTYSIEALESMLKFLKDNPDINPSKIPGSISDDFDGLNKLK